MAEDSATIRVHAKALIDALHKMPPDLFETVVGRATSSGMTHVIKDVKARISALGLRGTGLLRDSIIKKFRKIKRRGISYAIVGPRVGKVASSSNTVENPGNYAHLVEGGTKPHRIRSRTGKPMFARSYGRWPSGFELGKEVHHPGQPARPFMKPALTENRTRIIGDFQKSLQRAVKRWERKVNGNA